MVQLLWELPVLPHAYVECQGLRQEEHTPLIFHVHTWKAEAGRAAVKTEQSEHQVKAIDKQIDWFADWMHGCNLQFTDALPALTNTVWWCESFTVKTRGHCLELCWGYRQEVMETGGFSFFKLEEVCGSGEYFSLHNHEVKFVTVGGRWFASKISWSRSCLSVWCWYHLASGCFQFWQTRIKCFLNKKKAYREGLSLMCCDKPTVKVRRNFWSLK